MAKYLSHRFRPELKHLFAPRLDFLDLCVQNVRSIEVLANGGNQLLNQRQCRDVSFKLSEVTEDVRKLVEHCGASAGHLFQPALKELYRCSEKAKVLISKCGEEQWWVAAVFQSRNENAFREILLEVSFCYSVIYEEAKSECKDWNEDLPDQRSVTSLFEPASLTDVQNDQQDLKQRLEYLANNPGSVELKGHSKREDAEQAQSLARYLLLRMYHASEPYHTLSQDSDLVWQNLGNEPRGTWGPARFIGSGSGSTGVCATTWLGIPCAKKEFHLKEFESMWLKEAAILAQMKHPGIIDFICCGNGQKRGDCFLAMELMEKNLFDLIEEQNGVYFPLHVVVDIIVQIARGMWYLHDRGVAHRDLKPQNVVLNKVRSVHKLEDQYCVKLIDFGVSKAEVEALKSNTVTDRGIGTMRYRAPEVQAPLAKRNRMIKVVWFKADVFSFAVTCAHLLSLKAPYSDHEQLGRGHYTALMNGSRPKLPNHYPAELVAVLDECWNTIPRKRPPFPEICTKLEILRHKLLRGFPTKNVQIDPRSLHFITTKFEIQSSLQKVSTPSTFNGVEDEIVRNEFVSVIPCTCGLTLDLFSQSPYAPRTDTTICNLCGVDIDKKLYHCEICHFDAHLECAQIENKVTVFFHDHDCHLLVQNFYDDNLDAICRFCEEPLHESEWVYRCERCDFDVHAICTKYPKERMLDAKHEHLLTVIQCPPRKSMSCVCCNGEIRGYTWYYTCSEIWCPFDIHPSCASLSSGPQLCINNNSHRLSLESRQSSFYCGKCYALGFSWSFRCNDCCVNIHPDCVYDMVEVNGDWIEACEKFMKENQSKDDYIKINLVSELLDKVPVSETLKASLLSRSSAPAVMTSMQKYTLKERPSLDATNDVNLQRKDTAERIKSKKMKAREVGQKSRAKSLKMLENLEKVVVDMESFKKSSQDTAGVLATVCEKLTRKQKLVREENAMWVQSKMSPGPRIAVFFRSYRNESGRICWEILPSLRSDMKEVCLAALCEEADHEHIVDKLPRMLTDELVEELAKKAQPLHGSGLQVVMRAMSTLGPFERTKLESVIIPSLNARVRWDLRAIERHYRQSMDPSEDKEKVKEMKRAEDTAAEWLRSELESGGYNILEMFGLQRVRYLVTQIPHEGDLPKHRRGSLAWLCTDHMNFGLRSGTLESYPLKYVNVKADYELRFPILRRQSLAKEQTARFFEGEEGRKYRELLTSLKCGQCDKLAGVHHASIEGISALVLMGPLLLETEQSIGAVDSLSLLLCSLAEIERCMHNVTVYTSSCAIDAENVSTDHSDDPSLSKRACLLLRDFSFYLDLVQVAFKRFLYEIKVLELPESEYPVESKIRKETVEGLCVKIPKTLFKWCLRSCGGRCGRSCRPALMQSFVKLGQNIVQHPSVAMELGQPIRGRSIITAPASLWTQVPVEPCAEPIELVPVTINYAKAITTEDYLGKGGFGTVFKCKWHNKDMVVKIIDLSPELEKLFEAEVKTLTSFRHPNAVQTFGFGYRKDKTEGFILMERMETDLSKLIQEVKDAGSPLLTVFPLDITLDMLFQIVEGMCYLHERRVIHRDIKPENILVNRPDKGRKPLERTYHLKLADFGTSKINEVDSMFTSFRRGTSAYMAPEVMSYELYAKDEETGKQGYTFKADVYSFGLLCSEILTGNRPFKHLPLVIIRTILNALERGEKPAVLPLECDDPLRMLIEDCWKFNPGARPDFWEIRRRLWECRVYHFFKMERPPTSSQTFRTDLESKLQAIREYQFKMGGLSDTIED